MHDKKKIQKVLSKKCPECGARLTVIEEKEIIFGISYSTHMVECPMCGYDDVYRDGKKDRNRRE